MSNSTNSSKFTLRNIAFAVTGTAAVALLLRYLHKKVCVPKHKKKCCGGEVAVARCPITGQTGTCPGAAAAASSSSSSSSQLRPIVLCGPSGVGKGTLVDQLHRDFPEQFLKAVSHTTRNPRQGEVNGVHYHFVDKATMEAEIAAGKFIEYANVHGNYYGTSIAAVENVAQTGKICILEIDVQGAENVTRTSLAPYYFFIHPPSVDELRARLTKRGSENDITMKTRLATAERELAFAQQNRDMFHYHVTNHEFDESYNAWKRILLSLYPHLDNDNTTNA